MKKIIFITLATAILCQPCFSEIIVEKKAQQQNTVDALFKTSRKRKTLRI